MMKFFPLTVALVSTAILCGTTSADTFVWDGTAGNGLFTGANWTINGGSAGQTITPDVPNSGGAPEDWQLNTHDIDINGATISENLQLKLQGGTLSITNGSNVALLPGGGGQNLSGLNLGQTTDPNAPPPAVSAEVVDSTLTTSRSNSGGNSLRVRFGSSLLVDNSTVNVNSETGAGNLDLNNGSMTLTNGSVLNVQQNAVLNNGGSLTIDGASTVDVQQRIAINNGGSLVIDGGSTVNSGGDEIDLTSNTSTMTVTNGNINALSIRTDDNSGVIFDTGLITLSDVNPLRSANGFNGSDWNWIGAAGDARIVHADSSNTASNLGFKASQGLFSIDGTRVNPASNPAVDGLAAFNAELLSLAVNQKYFQLADNGTTQELFLVEVPVPTLQVFADTGLARIVNDTSETLDMKSYQITSADVENDGGSLDPNGWLSFEDRTLSQFPAGNGTGNGWEEGDNPSDEFLIESNLFGPTSMMAPGDMVSLGELYTPGDSQDLEFLVFSPFFEDILEAKVEYFSTTPLEADFDEDGTVDGDDLDTWETGYGTFGSAQKADGDSDFDGDVDSSDFLRWQRQAGESILLAPAVTAVPEPETCGLLLMGLAGFVVRRRLPKRGLLALILLVAFMGGMVADAQAQQPNIIFIMADDFGFADTSNTLTTLGDPSDFYETPKLAELAAEGMAFTNAYANQNCAPTRTAILSGAYAPRSTNNVYQVGTLNRGGSSTLLVGPNQGTTGSNDKLPTSTITHAETLQSAGYTTAYIGKFHVTEDAAQITANHGFDINYGGSTTGGPGDYHASGGVFGGSIGPGLDPYAANYTQQYVNDNIKPYANGTSLSAIDALVGTAKHVTDASADAAIDFMNTQIGTDPFFIQYSSHAVHTPIGNSQARDDLLAKYQAKPAGVEDSNASFGALIEGLDQSIARIIDHLENTPDPRDPNSMLAENTLVVFYSDNGGRQNQSNNSNLKGQKGELDEGGIRVPMIAWSGDPNLVDGGTINDTPVMPIDFYKTFATLGGASLPAQTLDGEDISGIIADNTAALGREKHYWHLPGYLDDSARDQFPQTVLRKNDWKLLFNYEDQSYELYDLSTDPSEATNVALANDAVVDELSEDIITWLDDVDAPLATLRSGSLDLFITGKAYANGTITNYAFETITINAGEEVPFIVDLSPADADTDMDGDVDVDDWIDFKAGQGLNMIGFTLEQSFMAGDIDGDLDNDIFDFFLFEASYNAVHGAGALAAVYAVPEPGSLILALLGFYLVGGRRR